MTFSFGLVAALALCANNLGLSHTPSEVATLLFPNMLCSQHRSECYPFNLQR